MLIRMALDKSGEITMAIIQTGAVIIAPLTIRTQFYFALDGQLGVTGIDHYITTITGGVGYYGDYANAWATVTGANFSALMSSNVVMLGARSYRRQAPGPLPLPGIASFPVGAGAIVPPDCPTQVSGIASFQAAISSRKGRSRMYVPFPPTSWVDTDATPAPGYITSLDALAASLIANVPLVGAVTYSTEAVIWHRSTLTTDPIISKRANKRWATQRRRGNYGDVNNPVIPG
jgi:hypothetical protein